MDLFIVGFGLDDWILQRWCCGVLDEETADRSRPASCLIWLCGVLLWSKLLIYIQQVVIKWTSFIVELKVKVCSTSDANLGFWNIFVYFHATHLFVFSNENYQIHIFIFVYILSPSESLFAVRLQSEFRGCLSSVVITLLMQLLFFFFHGQKHYLSVCCIELVSTEAPVAADCWETDTEAFKYILMLPLATWLSQLMLKSLGWDSLPHKGSQSTTELTAEQ